MKLETLHPIKGSVSLRKEQTLKHIKKTVKKYKLNADIPLSDEECIHQILALTQKK